MKNRIRVLLIEDNTLLRKGILAILNTRVDITVKAVTGRKKDIEQIVNFYVPEVILLSLGLYRQNSLQLMKELKGTFPDAKMLIMDLAPTKKEILQFKDAGASGFILKDIPTLEFIYTIKAVARDKTADSRFYTDLLLAQIVEHAVVKETLDLKSSVQITKFEMKLLQLLNDGASNLDIGIELGITVESVITHIHNIKLKLSLFTLLDLEQVEPLTSNSRDDEQGAI